MWAGRTAIPFLALGLLAPGCGGDSEEPAKRPETTSTAPSDRTPPERGGRTRRGGSKGGATLTAAEYRKAANRLCREDEAAVERLGQPDSPRSITRYLRRALKYSERRRPLYEKLRPPAGMRADHNASLRLSEKGEETLAEVLERIDGGGDPVKEFAKALPTVAGIIDRSNRLSRRLGTKDCIVDVPSPGAQPPRSTS